MDSFELNKIIGAVLGTLLFVMGVGFLAEAVYEPIEDRGPGYELPEPELTAEAGPVAPAEPAVPLGVLLASASAEAGQSNTRPCQSCHNFNEGGANKTGPDLYDVVERPIGSHEGFNYSDALTQLHEAGETWTYENLDKFLTSPKAFAPGTKMSFAGVPDDKKRADILAYLQTLSASPKPFPAAEAAPAAAAPEGAAPAAAPAAASEPVAPAAPPVDTPTTTQGETQVQGTPTTTAPSVQPTPPAPAPAATDTAPQPAPAQPAAPASAAPATP